MTKCVVHHLGDPDPFEKIEEVTTVSVNGTRDGDGIDGESKKDGSEDH